MIQKSKILQMRLKNDSKGLINVINDAECR